jgi:hypothetical protein
MEEKFEESGVKGCSVKVQRQMRRKTYQVEGACAGFAGYAVVAADLQDEDGVGPRRSFVAVGGSHHPVLYGAVQKALDGPAVRHVLDLQIKRTSRFRTFVSTANVYEKVLKLTGMMRA